MVRKYVRKGPRPWRDKDKRMAAAVRLRAEGKSLREIAAEIGVSYSTVANDIKASLSELPGQAAGDGGYIYVLRYDDDLVKVGRTRDARGRLTDHAKTGRAFGRQMIQWWVSPPHDGWRQNEKALIGFAAELGEVVGAEYFPRISFDSVVEKAEALPFPAPDPIAARAASREEPPRLRQYAKDIQAQIRYGGLTEDEAAEELADWVARTAPGFARVLLEQAMRELLAADEPQSQAVLW